MARYLRFYGKKRGARRTGSRVLSSFGAGCFWGVFFLAGCGALLAVVGYYTIPELRVNRDYIEQTCRVLGVRIDAVQQRDGLVYAPEIQVRFRVGEKEYVTWGKYDITDLHTHDRGRSEAILEQFEAGRDYRCWYDPRDPRRVVLARGYSWFAWLLLLFPLPFIAVGGGGLFYVVLNWGKSQERRAVEAQRAAERDLFTEATSGPLKFPSLPATAGLTDSPGTTLAYRLPTAGGRWRLLALAAFCLVWNGVVAVFVVMAVRQYLQGTPDWFLTLFITPFLLVGLALLGVLVRQVLVDTGVRPTIVEISEHPLHPGGKYEVFISQAGRLNVKSLAVSLVCEEEATYRQGTNTRTTTRRVRELPIFRREHFDITRAAPFEARLPLIIPSAAMHSFRSDHNQVQWKLVVDANVANWPDFQRSFLVHVYPDSNGSGAA